MEAQTSKGFERHDPNEYGPTPTVKPTVGRIVHYQSYGSPGGEYPSKARAAIVTDVLDHEGATVGLSIHSPQGIMFQDRVLYSEEPKPGYWNWPPRT